MVSVVILRGGIQFVRSSGFRLVLVTTFVPSPLGTYGLSSQGGVSVVIGEGAPSGIWVCALPSGLGPWRYPGGRGSGVSVGQVGR